MKSKAALFLGWLALGLFLALGARATFAQDTPTPYPTPTGIPIPESDLFGGLGQGDQLLGSVDGTQLDAPDGAPLLPEDNTALIVGYAKWLISPAAAQEVTGGFAPLFISVGIWLQMALALVALYVVVFVGVYFLRWVIWLVRLILQIVSAIASVANGVVGWLLGFIGL